MHQAASQSESESIIQTAEHLSLDQTFISTLSLSLFSSKQSALFHLCDVTVVQLNSIIYNWPSQVLQSTFSWIRARPFLPIMR